MKEQNEGQGGMLGGGFTEGVREGREVFLEETGAVRSQYLAKLLLF
jgi:hypothetical protein